MSTTEQTPAFPNPADPANPANPTTSIGIAAPPPSLNADALDVIADAASTLSGIADALAYRTASYPDDMLELLAAAAKTHAAALRELGIIDSGLS